MATFACNSCGYQGSFSEFSLGTTHTETIGDDDDPGQEELEVDDVECPECGSASVFEI